MRLMPGEDFGGAGRAGEGEVSARQELCEDCMRVINPRTFN
jgi:hypothetical protein